MEIEKASLITLLRLWERPINVVRQQTQLQQLNEVCDLLQDLINRRSAEYATGDVHHSHVTSDIDSALRELERLRAKL